MNNQQIDIKQEEDIPTFNVGDNVEVHLVWKGELFDHPPHGERGVIEVGTWQDPQKSKLTGPIVVFPHADREGYPGSERRFFNPQFLRVIEGDIKLIVEDGSTCVINEKTGEKTVIPGSTWLKAVPM